MFLLLYLRCNSNRHSSAYYYAWTVVLLADSLISHTIRVGIKAGASQARTIYQNYNKDVITEESPELYEKLDA